MSEFVSPNALFCYSKISPVFVGFVGAIWMIDFAIIVFCIGQGLKYIYPNTKMQPFQKRSYWITVLSFGSFIMVIALAGFVCYADNDVVAGIMTIVLLLCALSAQATALFQLAGRVYHTFKHSSHEISQSYYRKLKIHCWISNILGVFSFICLGIDLFRPETNQSLAPFEWKFFAAFFLVFAIIYYWVISWKCVLLFSNKLMMIVVAAMNSVRDIHKISNLNINDKQAKFLNTITKHMVLAAVKLTVTIIGALVILTTAVYVFSITLSRGASKEERMRVGGIGFAVFGSIGIIDDGLTVLCMYMHYQFADNVYNKLCDCCHNYARRKWDKQTKNNMTERALSIHSRASMNTNENEEKSIPVHSDDDQL